MFNVQPILACWIRYQKYCTGKLASANIVGDIQSDHTISIVKNENVINFFSTICIIKIYLNIAVAFVNRHF